MERYIGRGSERGGGRREMQGARTSDVTDSLPHDVTDSLPQYDASAWPSEPDVIVRSDNGRTVQGHSVSIDKTSRQRQSPQTELSGDVGSLPDLSRCV